ncbi:TlpA family protein disulfide reductase [Carboxylicivirga sp. RSCT41]|uniref:TlpA family protein disulfide reductase n=1 Tax=Carboxylicivirga agarovorans TaxID=3417570 RepID=UPI003D34B968
MNLKTLSLIAVCATLMSACSKEKTIRLTLNHQNGYGHFKSSLGGIAPYSDDENNPWKETYLSLSGAPENWSEIKYGDIETNIYQSVYQNYLAGKISQERYEELQKSWNWEPDTLQLSKEPLMTKIAFAFGKDPAGITNMIVDANNNLDFSDDESFVPFNYSPNERINLDSIASTNSINVSFERLIENKKQLVTAPLLIVYMSRYNIFMCNFAQHAVADFEGRKVAVCSDGFTGLSYNNPRIALLADSLKEGDKIKRDQLISKNEFIEINGKLYKNIGVNVNSNTLELEEMTLPKSELHSTQIGFKAFSYDGNDFTTEAQVSSEQLKGKYVLLDFWATWCGPCRQDIPNLKELYEKTDRDKFEIIGIVGDSPSKALKEIIEKDSIGWTQVQSTDSNKIKETFGIHGYPTTFLINPEGIIVAKNLRGKELEERVLELTND